jgi:hypothetical protein
MVGGAERALRRLRAVQPRLGLRFGLPGAERATAGYRTARAAQRLV